MSPATIHLPALDLDAKRIAATSAAIAIHAFAFLLLLAPVQWSPPSEPIVEDDPIRPIDTVLRETPPPLPDPRPIEITRTPPPPTYSPPVMEQLEIAPVDVVIPPGEALTSDEGEVGPPVEFIEPAFPTGPQELAVRIGPAPSYPIQALRQGIEGRVVLVIDVDAAGVPTGGHIESSSGSSLLDRAALKFVLAKWRFVPAMHAGQPIATSARVPVEFVINE